VSKSNNPSALEKKFSILWGAIHGQELIEEHKFHDTRKWRFDFAHEEAKVAIEIEGAVWTGGRHTRGSGYVKDCEKYNEATFSGWAVIRLTGKDINTENLERIKLLINRRSDFFVDPV
jgi:very-short-patch-repair endonuclease